MNEKKYLAVARYLNCRQNLLKTVKILCEWLPRAVVAAFAAGIIYLALENDMRIWRFILVPAAAFAAVTVIRKVYKSKRPYEAFNIKPLVKKDKKGESMPSRHTASAVIIAFAFLYISIPVGIAMLCVSAVIGITRVLCAVHFPRDILVGAAISCAFAFVGFFVI